MGDALMLADIARQVLASIDAGTPYTPTVRAWLLDNANAVASIDPALAERMREVAPEDDDACHCGHPDCGAC